MSALGKVLGDLVVEVEKRNSAHSVAHSVAGCDRKDFCVHAQSMTVNLLRFFDAVVTSLEAEKVFDRMFSQNPSGPPRRRGKLARVREPTSVGERIVEIPEENPT